MKKFNHLAAIAISTTLLSGCFAKQSDLDKANSELERITAQIFQLREKLGDWQYQGEDPQLAYIIHDVEFIHPKTKYGTPSVKYRANTKQTNPKFPLQKYTINTTYAIYDAQKNEIAQLLTYGTIENGVLAVAEEEKLYSVKKGPFNPQTMAVKYYEWIPELRFKPTKNSQ